MAESIGMVVENSGGIITAAPNNAHFGILKSIVEGSVSPVL